MKSDHLLDEIKELGENLLYCQDNFLIMKQSVEKLHEIFYSITNISAFNFQEPDIELPSGKAISPASAAHCLIEMKRTAVFLRGIYKAIQNKFDKKPGHIRFLYAGCGPYATLILPLLPLLSPENIRFTLVDINKKSLDSAKKLIQELKLNDFVDNYYLEDLTNFKLDKPYDIVLSETMQSCLENEPQVHIMRNIVPQMQEDAIFLPEEINLRFYLNNHSLFMEKILYENRHKNIVDKIFVDDFISVNKQTILNHSFEKIVQVPEDFGNYKDLMIFTFITVYKDEILKERESSLNNPKFYFDLSKDYSPFIKFQLDINGKPKIKSEIAEKKEAVI